jgi:GNAT superfamily N-acetyltransferase
MDTSIGYLDARLGTPNAENDFIECFREVFAGAPYYEEHTRKFVREHLWHPHVAHGDIVLAYDGSELAGFACALPLSGLADSIAREAREALQDCGYRGDLEHMWYQTELGVRENYRFRGIGSGLIFHSLTRMREQGGIDYCLQTLAKGSHSAHLYRKIGAVQLLVNRHFMYLAGSCDDGIRGLKPP